jgi:coatomer subunit beta
LVGDGITSIRDVDTNCCIGEDALANLSVEKEGDDGPVTGFVRIRSRSQGLALSLGSLKGLNKIGEYV